MSVFDEILGVKEMKVEQHFKPLETVNHSIDPRADLAADHSLWTKILTNAEEIFDEHKYEFSGNKTSLFKILHGLRCGGARIEETKHAFKLHPGDEDFILADEWDKIRQKWLQPVRDDLLKLFSLSKLGKVIEQELPPGMFENDPDNATKLQFPQQRLFG